jgi:hypothetical protein
MTRLLMLVGVAVLGAAMYAAGSPASQQSIDPTAKQFVALKKQVAALSEKVRKQGKDLDSLAFAYVHCSLHSALLIDRRGDSGGAFGYSFTPNSGSPRLGTALDLATAPSQLVTPFWPITPFNQADATCASLLGKTLRHNAASVIAETFARRGP